MCLSIPGLAAASRWYVGVGYGSAYSENADENVYAITAPMTAPVASYATSYGASSIFGGYQFTRYAALELAYTDFGTYNLNAIDAASGATYAESDQISALSMSFISYYPVNRVFSVFWKLGIASTTDSETCSSSSSPCASHSSVGLTPLLGIGGNIALNPAINLRFEYDEYDNIGNTYWDYTAGTFSNVNVSVLFRF